MEEKEILKAQLQIMVSALRMNLWVGISVLVFFSMLDFRLASAFTAVVIVLFRGWESCIAYFNNRAASSDLLQMRNVVVQQLMRTGEAESLDDAFRKADNIAAAYPTEPSHTVLSLLVGISFETLWLVGCGWLGLYLSPAIQSGLQGMGV